MYPLIIVIELSAVQFQNRTSAQREIDLKSRVWFRTKIARHELQLSLYHIHFEIDQLFTNLFY